MIPNLKGKLKNLSSSSLSSKESNTILENPTRNCGTVKEESSEDIQNRTIENPNNFGGQLITSPDGSFVKKRILYGTDASYGSTSLAKLFAWDFSNSQWWTRLDQDFNPKDIVFLDTETTGLSGGSGTYAFLVGLGYITDEGLVVEQYLMRDFDEEYPMLQSVIDTLKNYQVLVTFNGKSFDWPLMESRLIYSRLKPLHWENTHLDLLHISRRIWGNYLESCSLSSIEENILGNVRHNDIPGSMIPKAYWDYLDTREADEMERIIKHNELDIVAMAALLLHISKLFLDPIAIASGDTSQLIRDASQLLGIARELERNDRIMEAAECYEACIRSAPNRSLKIEAKKRIAYMKKRHEGPGEAMDLWLDLADEQGSMLLFPFIEMAKYFEHKSKDFQNALDCTDKAIQMTKMRSTSSNLLEDLLKRRRRLIRKLGRGNKQWG